MNGRETSPQVSAGSPTRGLRHVRRTVRRIEDNLLGTVTRVRIRESVAALTFDDGPHPVHTPRILDCLEAHGARGTFFMLGLHAAAHPDVVRRIADAGHAIANHSWDHPEFPRISWRRRRRQIRSCEEAIAPYGEPLFRPPKSLQSLGSFLSVRSLGYQPVAWSVEIGDWRPQAAESLAEALVDRLRPGAIVVLHDALHNPPSPRAADRTPLVEALGIALQALGNSYRFTTLPELLRLGKPVRRRWFVRSDDDWD